MAIHSSEQFSEMISHSGTVKTDQDGGFHAYSQKSTATISPSKRQRRLADVDRRTDYTGQTDRSSGAESRHKMKVTGRPAQEAYSNERDPESGQKGATGVGSAQSTIRTLKRRLVQFNHK